MSSLPYQILENLDIYIITKEQGFCGLHFKYYSKIAKLKMQESNIRKWILKDSMGTLLWWFNQRSSEFL